MLAWIGCLCVGCSTVSKGIDIAQLPPPYTVIIYENGHPTVERTIAEDSGEAQLIAKWLESNRTGWTVTPVTYAPSRLIRGDSFSLNVSRDRCVLNCTEGQFYKKADTTALDAMLYPAPRSLAHFRFNGNAEDVNEGNPEFKLQNTEFRDNALYLNGRYEFSTAKDGYRAICKTAPLDIENFTVALRFKSEESDIGTRNLFTGGVDVYRWFGLERSRSGNLVVMLNNGLFQKEVKGAALENGKWTVLACSVDIPARKVITAVNGKNVGVIEIPKDFRTIDIPKQFEGIDLPMEIEASIAQLRKKDTEKDWSFTNYSHGGCFHGLVDELIIYGRALSTEELEKIPLRP